jgi:hypothetical protein
MFAGEQNRGNGFAVLIDIQQNRRSGRIPIPNVVVRDLVIPLQLAIAGIDGQQRVGVKMTSGCMGVQIAGRGVKNSRLISGEMSPERTSGLR